MTAAQGGEDPSLDLPALPGLRGELGSVAFPPLSDDPPAPAVVGAAARVVVRRDGLTLEADGATILERLGVTGSTPADPRTTPLGIERMLETEGTVTERAVVPLRAAVGFFEWTAEGARRWRVEWRVPAGALDDGGGEAADPVRWRSDEGALVIARGRRRLLVLVSTPASWEIARYGPDLRVGLSVEPTRRVTLGAAVVREGEEQAVGRALGRAAIAVRGRESRVRRLLDERLRLEASEPEPGRALAWATVELAIREAAPGGRVGWTEAATAEALLASGEASSVRRLIQRAFSRDPAGPPALALLDRYLAWTGDRATAASVWDRALVSAQRLAGPTHVDVPDGAPGPTAHPARTLPEAVEAGLARVAEDIGVEPPAARPPGLEENHTDATRLDAVAGLLDRVRGNTDPTAVAAARVLRLIALLGVEPDAPRGRLTLRPRPPDRWSRFRVWNLRVGGSDVELSFSREGGTTRYALRQTRGAPPLQVVFEPVVSAPPVRARVDGAPAELDTVPDGREAGGELEGLWRVPVQLVLDRDRTVDLELATDDR